MTKNYVSPHVHIKSFDSASSPEQFAKREVELGTGHIVITDHGTLEGTRQVYDLTAKGGKYNGKLKPILGVEGYFRDDSCPILTEHHNDARSPDGSFRDYIKYTHLTLHAIDEDGYSALSRVLSAADLRAERHGSERKPLFTWENLADLGSHNITVTSGCLIGMVGRHLLKNSDPVVAMKYYEKLRSSFKPGNFYVELFPHVCDRNWESKVVIHTTTGDKDLPPWKKVKTHHAVDGISISDLASEFHKSPDSAMKKHKAILEIMTDRKWAPVEAPMELVNVEKREGWLMNECRPWSPDGDVQLGVNRFLLRMAHKYGDPVLLSDDSHFAYPEERVVQDIRLGQSGSWRFANSHHRMTSDEAWQYCEHRLGADRQMFDGWVENTYQWADRFKDFKFTSRKTLPTSFYPPDTLRHTMELIKRHGRMDWSNQEWVARLTAEINLLYKNGTIDLLPYFQIDEEVCRLYTRNNLLVGPGRGSAAGLLLTYLLGITHIDPIKRKLSMDRFLTLDRIQSGKMPDIDQDLPSRELLVGTEEKGGWLQERFGDCVAQISTDSTMKLKSAIKDTFRALDREAGNPHPRVPQEIEDFCRTLPNPPQGIPDREYVFGYKDSDGNPIPGLLETSTQLQTFAHQYPKQWDIVQRLLGLPRSRSRHASAYVIADEPIYNFIPLQTIGDVRVTSFTANAVEAAGGLKMDFLVVNSIRDIDSAVKLIRSRHLKQELSVDSEGIKYLDVQGKKVPETRLVPFAGTVYDLWDLPEDVEVFKDICTSKVETVFQFDAASARMGLRHFVLDKDGNPPMKRIEDLAVFTALDRPGPLDAYVEDANGNRHNMLVEYARRARGLPGTGAFEVLDRLLPETLGVLVYQEQLQYIFQTIGKTTGIEANNFRQRIGKKKLAEVLTKDKPLFMKGAIETLGKEDAERLWGTMETFGQYGFNKSHAVCYVVVAYACAWLKHHYPLEWWTAVLTNADRSEIDEKFWRYCGHLIDLPDVQKSKGNFTIEGDRIQAPLSLLKGLGEKAHNQLVENGPYTTIEDFVQKIEDWKVRNPRELKSKKDGTVSKVKGVSALNNTVVQNLIVSGAMDSLFPKNDEAGLPTTIEDRLTSYVFAVKKVTGKKVKSIATKLNLQSPLVRYQFRKQILPAYAEALLPIVEADNNVPDIKNGMLVPTDTNGVKEPTRIVSGKEYEILGGLGPLELELNVAMIAYVVAERRFSYTKKETGEQKHACELTLDVDGVRMNIPKWPGKKGLPDAFNNDLTGSVVACTFWRSQGGQDFFFADVIVLAPPLNPKGEEEESP